MPDAHKNFAYSTVLTAPSPADSGTSLVVQSGDGTKFPTVPFNATIWPVSAQPTTANAEIVRVTNIATDTFTITRTQESTSARTVVVGDQIAATITALTLTDVEGVASAAIPKSLVDAKGDLIAATAADTVARLAVGTDFLAELIPDSSASTGLRWGYRRRGLRPTGSLFETYSREYGGGASAALVSQRLHLIGIDLPSGLLVTSITFISASTALATGVNQLFGLYSSARALLRGSNDDTSTAWAASTAKTLNLTSTYTTTVAGLHYLGILINATTVPNLQAQLSASSAVMAAITPLACGPSTTAVTALPDPAAG